jgi:hypothetical protein
MTRWAALLLWAMVAGTGCASDRILALELRPPRAPDGGPAVPPEVASFEVRLSRLEDGAGCPTVDEAAAGRGGGRLAHAQAFAASDGTSPAMGTAIGEVPEGRWAIAALGRSAACEVVLFGCTELSVGPDAPPVVAVELRPVATVQTCGCRSCDAEGTCTPVARRCE